ncbi:hypothetical protein KUV23_11485 [Algoriphagus marincola]|uniref:Uncharacterized protein n=1 Tax=Algoriphagus marincola TaxID=264027 RepID=A0ABS7N5J3_9BACT|nr:hypothetical protein [Algoriphagus marincola]MBY5951601.1 hypothetical protein [Algoriphagus marincola]
MQYSQGKVQRLETQDSGRNVQRLETQDSGVRRYRTAEIYISRSCS